MKTKIRFYLFLTLAALLLVAQFACVKNKPEQAEEAAVAKKVETMKPQELQAQAQQLESLNQKLQARIDSLRQWEAELNSRAAHLDSLEKELQTREQELSKAQQSLKNFRATAYLVLFIGIVLIAVAVILLFRSKEDKSKEVKAEQPTAPKAEETKPAPETKTETAEEKKPGRAKKEKAAEKEPEKPKTARANKSAGTSRKRTPRASKKSEEKESEK